jgi:hypothetical protein
MSRAKLRAKPRVKSRARPRVRPRARPRVKSRVKSRIAPPLSGSSELEAPDDFEQPQTHLLAAQPALAGVLIVAIIGMISLAAFMHR